jgi:hypothetical protein
MPKRQSGNKKGKQSNFAKREGEDKFDKKESYRN